MTPPTYQRIVDGVWHTCIADADLAALVAERDALAARLAEAGEALVLANTAMDVLEARVAALTEALRAAQFFITASAPLILEGDISGEGSEIGAEVLTEIEALIGSYEPGMLAQAAADRPEGTTCGNCGLDLHDGETHIATEAGCVEATTPQEGNA